jgi:hypothetical protein
VVGGRRDLDLFQLHLRYSDGVLDRGRRRWIGVREDHTGEGEPVNTIVAIDRLNKQRGILNRELIP